MYPALINKLSFQRVGLSVFLLSLFSPVRNQTLNLTNQLSFRILSGLHYGVGSRSCQTQGGKRTIAEETGRDNGNAEESGSLLRLHATNFEYYIWYMATIFILPWPSHFLIKFSVLCYSDEWFVSTPYWSPALPIKIRSLIFSWDYFPINTSVLSFYPPSISLSKSWFCAMGTYGSSPLPTDPIFPFSENWIFTGTSRLLPSKFNLWYILETTFPIISLWHCWWDEILNPDRN